MESLIALMVGSPVGLAVFIPLILAMKNHVAICIMCCMAVFGFFVFSPLLLCWPIALIWAVVGEKE